MKIGCLILVVVSLITATTLLVTASMVYGGIVDEVNLDKPLEEKISGGDRTRILNVLGQHADTFPASRKRLRLVGFGLWGIISFLTFGVAAVACFGSYK
jgi:hypothetical protein